MHFSIFTFVSLNITTVVAVAVHIQLTRFDHFVPYTALSKPIRIENFIPRFNNGSQKGAPYGGTPSAMFLSGNLYNYRVEILF